MITKVEPLLGYMMWQADAPYSLCGGWDTTRRSLLIGYDMISLRGLAETEAQMAARGIRCCSTLVEEATEEDQMCYASTVNSVFLPDMLSWSVCQHTAEGAFESTAFYLGQKRPVPFVLTEEEASLCTRFFFFATGMRLHPDGRRKTTVAKMRSQVEALFRRYSIVIVPIRFRIPDGVSPCEIGTDLE